METEATVVVEEDTRVEEVDIPLEEAEGTTETEVLVTVIEAARTKMAMIAMLYKIKTQDLTRHWPSVSKDSWICSWICCFCSVLVLLRGKKAVLYFYFSRP